MTLLLKIGINCNNYGNDNEKYKESALKYQQNRLSEVNMSSN